MSAAAVLPMMRAMAAPTASGVLVQGERWSDCLLGDIAAMEEPPAARVPEIAFYRKYTEGMLRRYVRLAMETGRVPSLIGQPMFRGRVTSYRVRSFEDVVIFVFDVEKCLRQLDERSQQLIARISLQEYTQGEAAELVGMSLRSVVRHYADALDKLTAIFLKAKLLEPAWEMDVEECQAPKKPVMRERG
jgi:Sigma-70, region 4